MRTITNTRHTDISLRILCVNGIDMNGKHIIKKEKNTICMAYYVLYHNIIATILQRYLRYEINWISYTIETNCNILSWRA